MRTIMSRCNMAALFLVIAMGAMLGDVQLRKAAAYPIQNFGGPCANVIPHNSTNDCAGGTSVPFGTECHYGTYNGVQNCCEYAVTRYTCPRPNGERHFMDIAYFRSNTAGKVCIGTEPNRLCQ